MLIAKLTISYDRGLARNDEKDLVKTADGVEVSVIGRGAVTSDGKVIRGLGTHFKSEQDAQIVTERDKEARRIYKAFRERFLTTPIDGLYAVPGKGIAKQFLKSLDVQLGLQVRVTEFEITTSGDMDAAEIAEWSGRIKRQLASVSLGRTKEVDEDGLRALEYLTSCPLLNQDTKRQVKNLIEGVRAQKLSRLELRRGLEKLDVKVEAGAILAPRRVPRLVGAA